MLAHVCFFSFAAIIVVGLSSAASSMGSCHVYMVPRPLIRILPLFLVRYVSRT
ncbi:hypothetical protein BDZ89DRAFT_1077003, partial [Hymenopellis radicata]